MLAGELDPPELILSDEGEPASSDKSTSRSAVSGQIPQVSLLISLIWHTLFCTINKRAIYILGFTSDRIRNYCTGCT